MFANLTGRLNNYCTRYAFLIVALFVLLCAGAVSLSLTRLDITTDTGRMFAASLPWKQRNTELEQLFPKDKDDLVAIIRARTPEEGRETAELLTKRLQEEPSHFTSVTEPDADPFYASHALLFLDKKDLASVLDSIIAAQPFLGTLAADPSARGLFSTFGLIAMGIKAGQDIPEGFAPALNNLATSLSEAAQGRSQPLSWQGVLAGKLGELGGNYQFVVTHPRLDYTSFQPAEAATRRMRQAIDSLPSIRSGRASALITGEAKLNDEEFSTVAHGMVWGLILSLSLVTLWLILAVRSVRVIIPILLTLIGGLLLTTGFAALTVRTLNLISVAFAILFVGIAVDFAIQYCVRFRSQHDEDGAPLPVEAAIARTGRESGGQIFVASLATAAGFLAFTPTHFIGVAQLGLIAGFGMLIAFLCTMTLLPALLTLFRATPDRKGAGFAFMKPVDHTLRRHRKRVIVLFVLLAVIGLALTPRLKFDADPLHTKNPNTEGMQALHLLEENPLTTPYNAQVIVADQAAAEKQARAFSALPSVHDVLWLGALVPEDQPAKLSMIEDAAAILLPSLDVPHAAPAPDAAAIRDAALQAAQQLDTARIQPGAPLARIRDALKTLSTASDTTVLAMNEALTRFLPTELTQLRGLMHPSPITMDTIPDNIRQDYQLPDGRMRLIIHPNGHMSETQTLRRFIHQLVTVNPKIAGPALEITSSAQTITHAFTMASLSALVMIAFILLVILRHLVDVILVLAPLLLSALLSVILIVVLPEMLNYANIIALPLLLGVGVSFNIYFVMNWRVGVRSPLSSPTARAVLFSALTTGTAFGSLAASAHPGTASMGRLLLLSLGCTLLCTLVLVPALLPKRTQDRE